MLMSIEVRQFSVNISETLLINHSTPFEVRWGTKTAMAFLAVLIYSLLFYGIFMFAQDVTL